MKLPAPMLAKAVATIPDGYSYEPKWDGFRAIIGFDGERVEIGSRGAKSLTKYFPELAAELEAKLPVPCVLDGEIIVRVGDRLDWEALSARIHPAASRIAKLSVDTPASFVAFDLLSAGDADYLSEPFETRRALLEELTSAFTAPLHLSQRTTDVALAQKWLVEFERAGLDGVVAKALDAPYSPDKRTMLKIKHHRTADVVVTGYRVHKSGTGVGSLLLGLYNDGELLGVGGASAFSDVRRRELIDELRPYTTTDDNGELVTGQSERNRFSGSKDLSFVPLRPERVVEVRYDQMERTRFRHTAQFERWRPDREAASCTFDQLEVPVAYDLGELLSTGGQPD
jgi:ATP-dependent DNA ligase